MRTILARDAIPTIHSDVLDILLRDTIGIRSTAFNLLRFAPDPSYRFHRNDYCDDDQRALQFYMIGRATSCYFFTTNTYGKKSLNIQPLAATWDRTMAVIGAITAWNPFYLSAYGNGIKFIIQCELLPMQSTSALTIP